MSKKQENLHEELSGRDTVTVQEALSLVSKKKLIKPYIADYVDDHALIRLGKKKVKHRLKKYLKWLAKQPLQSTDLVVFVSHYIDDDKPYQISPDFNVQERAHLGDPNHRLSIIYTPAGETLAAKIVLTWRTRYYLYELLSWLMYQINWTGWHQEGLAEETKSLEESAKEIENGTDDSSNYITEEELYQELGIDRTKEDHFDSVEQQLRRQIQLDRVHLWKHSFEKEARKAQRILEAPQISTDHRKGKAVNTDLQGLSKADEPVAYHSVVATNQADLPETDQHDDGYRRADPKLWSADGISTAQVRMMLPDQSKLDHPLAKIELGMDYTQMLGDTELVKDSIAVFEYNNDKTRDATSNYEIRVKDNQIIAERKDPSSAPDCCACLSAQFCELATSGGEGLQTFRPWGRYY